MKKLALVSAFLMLPLLCRAMDNQMAPATELNVTAQADAVTARQGIGQKMKAAWNKIPAEAKAMGAVYGGLALFVGGIAYLESYVTKQSARKNYKNFLIAYKQLHALHNAFSKCLHYKEMLKGPKAGEKITKDHPYITQSLDILHTLYKQVNKELPIPSNGSMLEELKITLKGCEIALGKISSWEIKNHYKALSDLIERLEIDPETLVKTQEDDAKNKLRDLNGFAEVATTALSLLAYAEQK